MKRKIISAAAVVLFTSTLLTQGFVVNGAPVSGILKTDLKGQSGLNENSAGNAVSEAVNKDSFRMDDYNAGTVHISSVADYKNFVIVCMSDSGSKGKTFVLDNDIELGRDDFSPVPVFAGFFDGNGHTIKGIEYEGKEGMCGVFRYILSDGVVANLNVVGNLKTDAKVNNLGGICGVNEGTVRNCSFTGSVIGYAQVGGIAGLNTGSGTITACRTHGIVQSSYYTGGIAGYSNGVISACTNSGAINSDENWVISDDTSGLDWVESVMNSEQKRTTSGVDSGGIVGYSKGIVIDSTNYGTVGYDHVGYNVGGIAGRQAGYLAKCTNCGLVFGRKDVGGVVGQMEPYITLDETESLSAAIDELHRLVDITITDMEGQSNTLSWDLRDLSNHADTVFDLSNQLTNETVDIAENSVDNAKEIADAANVGKYISDADNKRLDEYKEESRKHSSNAADAREYKTLRKKYDEYEADRDNKPEPTEHELEKMTELGDKAVEAPSSGTQTTLKALYEATNPLDNIDAYITKEEAEANEYSAKCLDILAPAVADAAENYPKDLEWKSFGDGYDDKLSKIYEETKTIGDILDRLNANANNTSVGVMEDYRDINDQVNRILNLFNGKINAVNDKMSEKLYNDISDKVIEESITGKVENCKNQAHVSADINVGGIAGNMGIDEDDPEDNAAGSNDISTDTYLSSCILSNSRNLGIVEAKKNGVGGIVGYMGNGVIYKCVNVGKVTTTTGDYAGGICGQSKGVIRNCSSASTVSGALYVGGIAGEADEIRDCKSMVVLTDYDSYVGAICGDVKKDSLADLANSLTKIKNNYYVDNGIGGINGIGFIDNACPVSLTQMKELDKDSTEFKNVSITFIEDGTVYKTVTYDYGIPVDSIKLPDVPKHTGEYGVWDDIPGTRLESNYVLEAQYFPYVTTISSDVLVEGKTAVFAEGEFTDLCTVDCTVDEYKKDGYNGTLYSICINSSDDSAAGKTFNYRIYNPSGEKAVVYQRVDGNWTKVDFVVRGSYIHIENLEPKAEILVGKKSFWRSK